MEKSMDKKEKILLSALKLIKQRKNISAITISDIAMHAGVGKGTVYEYFDNKEDIFEKAIYYFVSNSVEDVIKVEEDKSFDEQFAQLVERISRTVAEGADVLDLFLNEHAMRMRDSKKSGMSNAGNILRKKVYAVFIALAKKGSSEGIIPKKISTYKLTFITDAIFRAICEHQKKDGVYDKLSLEELTKLCRDSFVSVFRPL